MGFRLYINDDLCFGKLYGYAENHLYSIDYLISTGILDDDLEEYWSNDDKSTYDKACELFNDYLRYEIEMEYKNFMVFIALYMADFAAYHIDSYTFNDLSQTLVDLRRLPSGFPVKLKWC